MNQALLQEILAILGIASNVAAGALSGNADAEKYAKLSAALTEIAQRTLLAHQQLTGQPIDTSLLVPYEPL